MAFTITPRDDFPDFKSWDVIADQDADQIDTFFHGFVDPDTGVGVAPLMVWTVKLLNLISVWGAQATGTLSIQVFKAPEAASGNAGAQVRVYAMRPHSLVL